MEKTGNKCKDNIKIDVKNKAVDICLNPRLYPQSVVMRATYRFIDDFNVIVDGDPLSDIFVRFKIKPGDTAGKEDMEELVNAFFAELIHANVEETQARRYADTRNALIGAALKNMIPLSLQSDANEKEEKDDKKDNCDSDEHSR